MILGSAIPGYAWKRKDGRRRFRRAYIEQGKGNGKSPVAGGIGIYGMTACKEAGAQGDRCTVEDVVLHWQVSSRTAKRDIANLKDRGLIRYLGSHRRGFYVAS